MTFQLPVLGWLFIIVATCVVLVDWLRALVGKVREPQDSPDTLVRRRLGADVLSFPTSAPGVGGYPAVTGSASDRREGEALSFPAEPVPVRLDVLDFWKPLTDVWETSPAAWDQADTIEEILDRLETGVEELEHRGAMLEAFIATAFGEEPS